MSSYFLQHNVGIVGSRDYPRLDQVKSCVEMLKASLDNFQIISGGARGVDTAAVEAAKELDIPYDVIEAEWDIYGKAAGMHRNRELVRMCDELFIFWDGQSPGTRNVIDLCSKSNVSYTIYRAEMDE